MSAAETAAAAFAVLTLLVGSFTIGYVVAGWLFEGIAWIIEWWRDR